MLIIIIIYVRPFYVLSSFLRTYSEIASAQMIQIKLFRKVSHPRSSKLRIKLAGPRGELKRHLAESSVSAEQAEDACATLKEAAPCIKDYVYDILTTQDKGMVDAH